MNDLIRAACFAEIVKIANGDDDEGGKGKGGEGGEGAAGGGKTPGRAAVVAFIKANPNPSDDDFHDWCEENGYDVHKAEQVAYSLATEAVNKTAGVMTEGKSHGKIPSDLDPNQLKMGVKVEKEHTTDPALASKISLDHLTEDPKYYTALDAMESKRKKEMGKAAACSGGGPGLKLKSKGKGRGLGTGKGKGPIGRMAKQALVNPGQAKGMFAKGVDWVSGIGKGKLKSQLKRVKYAPMSSLKG